MIFMLLLATGVWNVAIGQEGADPCDMFPCSHGAIIRGDTTVRKLAIVFTGHEYAGGAWTIIKSLKSHGVKASFFFTGDFYRNHEFSAIITALRDEGHYLGAHSDRHLLYCDWERRDSLLVSKSRFKADLKANYWEMEKSGISHEDAPYFLPPYEWYNDSISAWTREAGLQLINFTPGTLSNADYTTLGMPNYRSSEEIFQSIIDYEANTPHGLNGFILLLHTGTAPERKDKFYDRLDDLISALQRKGYVLVRIDELLSQK